MINDFLNFYMTFSPNRLFLHICLQHLPDYKLLSGKFGAETS